MSTPNLIAFLISLALNVGQLIVIVYFMDEVKRLRRP